MSAKRVLLTGGAGGLGAATTRHLVGHGFRVFAGDLPGPALDEIGALEGVTPVELDVTSPESLDAARTVVEAACDGLDGVVNFAGILALGSLIEIEEADLRRVLDVNVLGTYRVNRTFFPLVRAAGGRIVTISSETGWQSAMPFNGGYAMSKHAVEAYSDALRRELMFLDVPVIKIQPGPFRTAMTRGIERAMTRAREGSTYFGEMLGALGERVLKEQDKAHDPALLAEVIHEALTARTPRPCYSVKPDPARTVISWLPTRLADGLLRASLR